MRRVVAAIASMVISILGASAIGAEARAASAITVDVAGLHNSDGVVECLLFSSPDGFPDDFAKALKTAKVPIDDARAVCEFRDVAAGDYAISVVHDENSNGKIDRNFIGMPKEGVGASNDAKGSFGPPKFADARFTLKDQPKVLTIHIRYLLAPL